MAPIINHKYKTGFIHIPRTSGTFYTNYLVKKDNKFIKDVYIIIYK